MYTNLRLPPETTSDTPANAERKQRSRAPWPIIGAIVGAVLMPTHPGQTEAGALLTIILFVVGGATIGAVFKELAGHRPGAQPAHSGWKSTCLCGLTAIPLILMWGLWNAYGEGTAVLASCLLGVAGLGFVIGGMGWLIRGDR